MRKSGETLRITAQLVRASDSSHLWSQTYDRQMTDVFKVQDEIAAAVVEQLKIKLLGAAPKQGDGPRGLCAFPAGPRDHSPVDRSGVRAIDYVEPAGPRTRSCIRGGVGGPGRGLLRSSVDSALRPADEAIRLAREATEKALTIAPQYAPAHARLGWIAIFYDRDLAAARSTSSRRLRWSQPTPKSWLAAAWLAALAGSSRQSQSGKYHVRDPVNAEGHLRSGHCLLLRWAPGRGYRCVSHRLSLFPRIGAT